MDFLVLVLLTCVIVPFEAFSGFFTNLIIISTSLSNILKRNNNNTIDKIMFSLGLSNMCHGIFQVINVCSFYLPFLQDFWGGNIMRELTVYKMNSSVWLTSCLCVFQFIKIVHFRWRFLSLLKMKIDVLVPWMILLVELLCLCNGFINIMVKVSPQTPSSSMNLSVYNTTEDTTTDIDVKLLSSLVSLAMVILITAGTLVSLQIHIHKMSKTFGSSSSSSSGPQRAVRTMWRLLVYYLLYFIISALQELGVVSGLLYIVYFIVKFSFGPVQSLLLILGNPNYKKALLKYLCVWCRMCGKG